MSTVWLEAVLEELRRVRGLDLSDFRRSTLERRLAARMARLRLRTPGSSCSGCGASPSECDQLIETIVIRVEFLFPGTPWSLSSWPIGSCPGLWSATGGSTPARFASGAPVAPPGKKPIPCLSSWPKPWRTRTSRGLSLYLRHGYRFRALATAQTGRYRRESLRPPNWESWTASSGPRQWALRVVRNSPDGLFLRDNLTSRHSLAPADSVFGSFDLVLCRNVLIYFSLDLQKRVQDKLYRSLNPGGIWSWGWPNPCRRRRYLS